jgi:hypothetical protein
LSEKENFPGLFYHIVGICGTTGCAVVQSTVIGFFGGILAIILVFKVYQKFVHGVYEL